MIAKAIVWSCRCPANPLSLKAWSGKALEAKIDGVIYVHGGKYLDFNVAAFPKEAVDYVLNVYRAGLWSVALSDDGVFLSLS